MTTGFSIREMAKLVGQYIGRDGSNIPVLPHPDFWMPLSSNINLLEGFGDVTFTRAGPATYTNKSGELTSAAVDEPRFEKEGILIEGESTNHWINSNNPNAWPSVGSGISFENAEANGLNSRVFTVPSTYEGSERLTSIAPPLDIPTSIFTAYFTWLSGAPIVRLRFSSEINDFIADSRISLEDLSVENSASIRESTITQTGSLIKVVVTLDDPEETQTRAEIYVETSGSAVEGSFSILGFQAEQLPFASSYIPTEGSAVTRAAESITVTAEGNLPEGNSPITLSVKVNELSIRDGEFHHSPQGSYHKLFAVLGDGVNSNQGELARVSRDPDGLLTWRWAYGDGGTWYFGADLSRPDHSFVFTSSGNSRRTVYEEGVEIALDDATREPVTLTGSVFNIGHYGGAYWWGHIRNFRIWHQTLTNEQIKLI